MAKRKAKIRWLEEIDTGRKRSRRFRSISTKNYVRVRKNYPGIFHFKRAK